ncbi:hypothetical protein BC936DRAFT_147080 [Jimgerdemannia flammicorona]|uniref:Uncharacterized protein n=1 Tax=Jimgerdemannia flammicorona TaxID=994334 RepID=A0A433D649_9FUNG|nr:hypothetical protein BC936DRAFT_147080 [Jimgerdemannia flammicorona]
MLTPPLNRVRYPRLSNTLNTPGPIPSASLPPPHEEIGSARERSVVEVRDRRPNSVLPDRRLQREPLPRRRRRPGAGLGHGLEGHCELIEEDAEGFEGRPWAVGECAHATGVVREISAEGAVENVAVKSGLDEALEDEVFGANHVLRGGSRCERAWGEDVAIKVVAPEGEEAQAMYKLMKDEELEVDLARLNLGVGREPEISLRIELSGDVVGVVVEVQVGEIELFDERLGTKKRMQKYSLCTLESIVIQ